MSPPDGEHLRPADAGRPRPRCTQCSWEDLRQGFLEDRGEGSGGDVRFVDGPLSRGPFGGAQRFGRSRRAVHAYHCTRCGHVELFVGEGVGGWRTSTR